GHGILNLSLSYAHSGPPMNHSETAYVRICDVIRQALLPLGIASSPQAVQGSFCDGRYNLAVGPAEQARKIVGTAQLWRRLSNPQPGLPTIQMVLVHAVLLVEVDCGQLTQHINRFEALLGTGTVYQADKLASLHTLRTGADQADDWMNCVEQALAGQLALWPHNAD